MKPRNRRTATIRWSLARSFIMIVLMSSLTVLALMGVRASHTERELSAQLIATGSAQVERALDAFLQPARTNTRLAVSWGRAGLLSIDDATDGEVDAVRATQIAGATQLNQILLPILAENEELSSVQIGTADGRGFLILETREGIKNRIVNRQRWGPRTLWFTVDVDGAARAPVWRTVDYDPRRRDWYRALEDLPDGAIGWTDPYTFFTTGEPGITAASAWSANGVRHAIAWDVLLTSVTAFTDELAAGLSPRANILITTGDKRVVGLPRHLAYDDPDVRLSGFLQSLESLVVPEARALAHASAGLSPPASFSYEVDNDTWWAGIREYRISNHLPLEIAVTVPDTDLLGNLARERLGILAATVVALLASLIYAMVLARSYSRPLEALAEQSRRIPELDFSQAEPVRVDFDELKALSEAQAQSLKALNSFARYVPTDVVSELVKTGEVARIGGRERELTVLFTDIADFTTIAEATPPDALADHLSEYFETAIEILLRHGATVDKLIGDSIMAFWGAPRSDPDHRRHAVDAVAALRTELGSRNAGWRTVGKPVLNTRFGLASGPVLVGNFGAPRRLAYTVFGDTVNLASRLEGLNKVYGTEVIAEDRVVDGAGEGHLWRRLDRVRVKGRSQPSWVYGLLDEGIDAGAAESYTRAWDLYADGAFEHALEALAELSITERDPAVERLERLCRERAGLPTPAAWNGITNIA